MDQISLQRPKEYKDFIVVSPRGTSFITRIHYWIGYFYFLWYIIESFWWQSQQRMVFHASLIVLWTKTAEIQIQICIFGSSLITANKSIMMKIQADVHVGLTHRWPWRSGKNGFLAIVWRSLRFNQSQLTNDIFIICTAFQFT